MKINKRTILKYLAVTAIITVTLVFFIVYLCNHQGLIATIKQLDLITLALLAIGYGLVTVINAVILYFSLRLIKKSSSLSDNIILTGYSSIVNFFGPLQSGPGFRAIYLKKKYGVKIRDFLVASLIFYGFFGFINLAILAAAGAVRFGVGILCVYILAGAALIASSLYLVEKKYKSVLPIIKSLKLNDPSFWMIGMGAIGITMATAATYFVEIHHIDQGVSIMQTLIYTAAANLSLFVAITPGAIGIRESFLAISQQLHGINTTTIVGASVIDRAFYISFLALMFVVLLAVNSRRHLSIFAKTKSNK